jgi:hypothetical protein
VIGAAAAWVEAASYVVSLVLVGAFLVPAGFGDGGPHEAVAPASDHHAMLHVLDIVAHPVAGSALVVLALAVWFTWMGRVLRRSSSAPVFTRG